MIANMPVIQINGITKKYSINPKESRKWGIGWNAENKEYNGRFKLDHIDKNCLRNMIRRQTLQ